LLTGYLELQMFPFFITAKLLLAALFLAAAISKLAAGLTNLPGG
jgi:hypothetical protein